MRMAAGRVPGDFTGHRVKETIAPNVWPDDLAIDDQGNVWIAELTGKMHRYDPATRQTTVIGQLETTDPTNIEHGLMGIEVDPNFHRGEPYVYVFYTKPESFVNTLSRYTFRDGKLDMASERVLLRVPTEPQCCHQAGDLEWGPGGTLFVSTGDTGQSGTKPDLEISETRIKAFVERNKLSDYHWSRIVDSERTSQNLQELRGKVLRVNRDGSIPRDNPFYGRPGVRWEIYAYGLRNPYRIKWDEQAGRLFIGIVGPDEQTTYDWYDISRGGENFGWPRVTGRLFYNEWTPQMIPGYAPSAWEYTYATGSRSASGGPMYRSTGKGAFPQLQGKVLMYDWSRRWIKYGEIVNGTFESDTIADVRSEKRQFRIPTKRLANIKTFDVLEKTSPISMEVGPDGCIYIAEFAGFWKPAPGSNVSRYCWVQGGASGTPATAPTATPATSGPPAGTTSTAPGGAR
jgi:glucose/arabinose dehydrogenase